MRIFFRIAGTWLLGMALILLIIDGTRSLAANGLVVTSLAETWLGLHADSLAAVHRFLASRFFGAALEPLLAFLLALPGWAVLGIPGAFLAWLGRTRRSRVFVRQDQL